MPTCEIEQLIRLRHLLTSSVASNLKFIVKKEMLYFMRAQPVLRYHIYMYTALSTLQRLPVSYRQTFDEDDQSMLPYIYGAEDICQEITGLI